MFPLLSASTPQHTAQLRGVVVVGCFVGVLGQLAVHLWVDEAETLWAPHGVEEVHSKAMQVSRGHYKPPEHSSQPSQPGSTPPSPTKTHPNTANRQVEFVLKQPTGLNFIGMMPAAALPGTVQASLDIYASSTGPTLTSGDEGQCATNPVTQGFLSQDPGPHLATHGLVAGCCLCMLLLLTGVTPYVDAQHDVCEAEQQGGPELLTTAGCGRQAHSGGHAPAAA